MIITHGLGVRVALTRLLRRGATSQVASVPCHRLLGALLAHLQGLGLGLGLGLGRNNNSLRLLPCRRLERKRRQDSGHLVGGSGRGLHRQNLEWALVPPPDLVVPPPGVSEPSLVLAVPLLGWGVSEPSLVLVVPPLVDSRFLLS